MKGSVTDHSLCNPLSHVSTPLTAPFVRAADSFLECPLAIVRHQLHLVSVISANLYSVTLLIIHCRDFHTESRSFWDDHMHTHIHAHKELPLAHMSRGKMFLRDKEKLPLLWAEIDIRNDAK